MSKPKRKTRSPDRSSDRSRTRSRFVIAATVVAIAGLSAAVAFLPGDQGGLDPLNGRWLRLDGGYVLEIRAVDPNGKMDAAYLNPKPVRIAEAKATRKGSVPTVFIELRGPNYPGSTYTLAYDSGHDQLRGTYFQAALQQSFDVIFVRMKQVSSGSDR